MKKYTDQGKVDTRSGFGAGLVENWKVFAWFFVIIMLCAVSCQEPLFEGEPEEGTSFLKEKYECYVNGEKVEYSRYESYSKFWFKTGYYNGCIYSLSGYVFDDNHNFKGVNNEELAFFLSLSCPNGIPLYTGNGGRVPFFFYIVGDGIHPFHEGEDYAGPNNIVYYFPESPVIVVPDSVYNDYYHIMSSDGFNGLKVELLSSSFRFGYDYVDEPCVGEVLDFYFDFEEVITSVPEGYNASPTVGDTIRVSNGHFVQSLFFENKEVMHQFIVPNEKK